MSPKPITIPNPSNFSSWTKTKTRVSQKQRRFLQSRYLNLTFSSHAFFHWLIGDHHQIIIIHKLLHHLEATEQERMHIWPSIKVRDSFKVAYLNNLQWNLHRMKRDTHRNSQPLLNRSGHDDHHDATSTWAWASVVCRDVFWILTCCFCFGVCEDVEDLI